MAMSELMGVNKDGNLFCKLCDSVLAKTGEPEEGLEVGIKLHFELFHDRYLEVEKGDK